MRDDARDEDGDDGGGGEGGPIKEEAICIPMVLVPLLRMTLTFEA